MRVTVLIDSYGWIEYFSDGPLADKYAKYIKKANTREYITPSIVLYEVYKKIKREKDEEKALEAYAYIVSYTRILPLDGNTSMKAAEKSLQTGLGMADSIILATAINNGAKIVTGDEHFKNIDNATYLK